MTGNVLLRLLALRRLNESRALEALTAQQAACSQAETEAEEASAAVARHLSAAGLRERELAGSIGDRAASLMELVDLQAQIELAALDGERLRRAERAARSILLESLQALASARETYRQCRQATAKLELLVQQEAARGSRRLAAIVEEEPAVAS